MDEPRGEVILEQLLEEFCAEIPAKDCPWLHLGSDEIRIAHPEQFVCRMSAKVHSLGRLPVIWNPGLPNDGSMMEQVWSDAEMVAPHSSAGQGMIDSSIGYANSYSALEFVPRYYFAQPCHAPRGDERLRGVILCVWPDTRVRDKMNVLRHSPVWPGIVTMAEATWVGRSGAGSGGCNLLPDPHSDAGLDYMEFEQRLAAHRDGFFAQEPFPFVQSAHIPWWIAGPFLATENDGPQAASPAQIARQAFARRPLARAWGGTICLAAFKAPGVFAQAQIGDAYALTWMQVEQARTVFAWIGFETPQRSNRQYGGIAQPGQWDAWGANVWVNEERVEPPQWQQPGKYQYLKPTWNMPANEIPLTDEELFWTRKPASIQLLPGWNRVLVKIPCGYLRQNWSFTFVPVKKDQNERWVEDAGIQFRLFEPSALPLEMEG
jgi:hypothetical protein